MAIIILDFTPFKYIVFYNCLISGGQVIVARQAALIIGTFAL